MDTFAAIDVETANDTPESVCSLGVVRVRGREITHRLARLIRPPTERFTFTHIHRLVWSDVADQPPFENIWPSVEGLIHDVRFIVAHRARFDEWALSACCRRTGLRMPPVPFHCTAALAQRTWGIRNPSLRDLCRRLQISHRPHDALSDAEAAAKVVLAAREYKLGRNA